MDASVIPPYGALLDPHLLRLAFVLGVIVAALAYDKFHLSTGSIVVPGYVGASVLNPISILFTFIVSVAVFWTVYKLMPHFWIMEGRQKFLVSLSISAGFQLMFLQLSGLSGLYWSGSPLLAAIGYVVPGLIAYDAARHGVSKTLVTTLATGFVVAVVLLTLIITFGSALQESTLPSYPRLTFNIQWIGLALLVSVIASAGLQYNFGLRAGGFVGCGYLALILVSLPDVAYLVVLSLATYLLVAKVLMKQEMILFGRRKFVSMILCSVLLSWSALLVVERGIGYGGLVASSLPMASVFVPGLFANDLERVGAMRLVMGTVLAVALVLSLTFLLIEITGEHRLHVILSLALASGTMSCFIFVRQVSERLAGLARISQTSMR